MDANPNPDYYFKLAEHKISIPYGICFDDDRNIWLAAKSGIHRLTSDGKTLLYEDRKKDGQNIAAFTNVLNLRGQGKVVLHKADDKLKISEIKVINYDGQLINSAAVEGKLHCSCVGPGNDLLYTKHPRDDSECSKLFACSLENLQDSRVVADAGEFAFQFVTYLKEKNVIAASVAKKPVTPASLTKLLFLDPTSGDMLEEFVDVGKVQGLTYTNDHLSAILMLKTGEFMLYPCKTLLHKLDAYLCNGLTDLEDKEGFRYLTCSGFIKDESDTTVCEDWITRIKL